jgi:hypothetical protein
LSAASAEVRYRLQEVLRQFAAERLEARGHLAFKPPNNGMPPSS